MSIVVDASMAIAWLFADERSDAAHAVMGRVVSDGAVVPSLWRLEVANVLRNAVRRGRCDEAYVDRSLERLSRFPVDIGCSPSLRHEERAKARPSGKSRPQSPLETRHGATPAIGNWIGPRR